MKTFNLLFALILISFSSFSQTKKFTVDMQKGINLIEQSKTVDAFSGAATFFENITITTPNEWLPQYYTAYANLFTALKGNQDATAKDQLYDKALKYISKADSIAPNNSEIYALNAYITFMKMSVAPQTRGMSLMPKSMALIARAIALDPENPRAYLIKGQNTFYTPEAYGGGKTKAKVILTQASEKFNTFKAAELSPNWGKESCAILLQSVKSEK